MDLKKPTDCTEEELESFKKVVLSGGQVTPTGLEARILNCKLLGFYYLEGKLVGISAIKQKDVESVRNIWNKAKIEGGLVPTLELGYSVTIEGFRGQGINKKLNDRLLESCANEKIYATTNNDIMRKYLSSKGFIKLGSTFNGKLNDTLDYYER